MAYKVSDYKTRDIRHIHINDIKARKIPVIEEIEKQGYIQRAQQGDPQAREHLVLSHLDFIGFIAKKYRTRKSVPDYMDLLQEGYISLMEAIDRFDPKFGVNFTGYAKEYIEGRILNTIVEQSRTVEISHNLAQKIRTVSTWIGECVKSGETIVEDDFVFELASRYLKEKYKYDGLDKEPTPEDIDKHLQRNSRSGGTIRYGYRLLVGYALGLHKTLPLRETTDETENLSHTVHRREEISEEIIERVAEALDRLDNTSRQVIELRWPFDGENVYTREDIGNAFQPPVTGERVRQIEKKSLKDLKSIL